MESSLNIVRQTLELLEITIASVTAVHKNGIRSTVSICPNSARHPVNGAPRHLPNKRFNQPSLK